MRAWGLRLRRAALQFVEHLTHEAFRARTLWECLESPR